MLNICESTIGQNVSPHEQMGLIIRNSDSQNPAEMPQFPHATMLTLCWYSAWPTFHFAEARPVKSTNLHLQLFHILISLDGTKVTSR